MKLRKTSEHNVENDFIVLEELDVGVSFTSHIEIDNYDRLGCLFCSHFTDRVSILRQRGARIEKGTLGSTEMKAVATAGAIYGRNIKHNALKLYIGCMNSVGGTSEVLQSRDFKYGLIGV